MIKILKTVAPTAEQLDFVIGNFFKENGMEYTSSMEYAPCIAGYGEFCEKRDLVYHLSEADEKKLRALITDPDTRFFETPVYQSSHPSGLAWNTVDKELSRHLSVCVLISAPLEWYERLTINASRIDLIGCIKSIDTIQKEDCSDGITIEQVHKLRVLHDAAIDTGSIQIARDFVSLLPDNFMLTRSFVFTYSNLACLYDRIAYSSISDNDSDELKQESKWIMAKWIRDLPCSFLMNPRFKNNCLAPLSDGKD